ncbi:MAG TPA: PhzF family phenazine biosynthesis protein [Candidatus Binatia bacterium]|nr:PhzF family phenazine biosynthesis protein [Candidatus Binatia bacterium]
MGLRITQVDAFTDTPFAGNPAAVCLLPAARDEGWMQSVAREMNLSETAFLVRQGDGFALRWFTPAVEVALCGHATLASAHVLWEDGHLPAQQQARFHTKSGLLTGDRAGEWIELDFPAKREEPAPAPPGLAEALGVTPKYVGKNQFDYLVEVDREDTVRRLAPNHAALAALPVRGVIVTSRADSAAYDFVSRFFAPGAGVPEDPVTGSAHCALGPFWQARLGKSELTAYQASPRGGIVRVRVAGERVKLGGQAVTVLRGELLEPGYRTADTRSRFTSS